MQEKTSPEEIEAVKERLEEAKQKQEALKNDKLLGDKAGQCYESIAKSVAIFAPDVRKALSIPVAVSLRDVIMSEGSENLFDISQDETDLEARINQRKIAEIEAIVCEKAKRMKIGDGVVLRFVDIHVVHFPEEIKTKIEEEAKTLIQERIEEIESRTKVATAQSKQKRAEFEAKATIIEARAKAQSRILEGQGEGEALAARFREVVRELRREEALKDDKILTLVISQLVGTLISAKDMEELAKLRTVSTQINLVGGSEGVNGSTTQAN